MPRFILYARKSSESEDRQVLSIDSQISELSAHAQRENLQIVDVLSESRSAKEPGRPVFNKMFEAIRRKRADGVLCWKLDRLARNPVDGGALIWALDRGQLREIVTREKRFADRGDDKFWMQLEFGMAKKYVDDLSDNVKRGNRAKLERGWLPGLPPLGYLNDLVTRTIIPDPILFPLIRKVIDLVLTGTAPLRVLEIANHDWGFRTRKHKRWGGGPLQASTLYKVLGNSFYYGLIARKEGSFMGAHTPLMTREEYDTIQRLLGRSERVHTKKHMFAFLGLIRCGECGCSVTAEEKTNRYGYHYTYYHCTKKKVGVPCSQKTVRLEKLEEQIVAMLSRIQISERFHAWALKNLHIVDAKERGTRQAVERSLDATSRDIDQQIDRLVDWGLRGRLNEEEFAAKKSKLVAEQLRLKEQRADVATREEQSLELFSKALNFANQARNRFEQGSIDDRREILVALGSNLALKDRTLRMEVQKPFLMMKEGSRVPSWWAHVKQIRTFFRENPSTIQWPGFCSESIVPETG